MEEKFMFCDKCGAKLIEGDSFCPACGSQVGNASAEPTVNPSVPVQPSPVQQAGSQPDFQPNSQPNFQPNALSQQPQPIYNPAVPAAEIRAQKPAYKKTGMIIGIAGGGVAVLALVIFLIWHFWGGGDNENPKITRPSRAVQTTTSGDAATSESGQASVTDDSVTDTVPVATTSEIEVTTEPTTAVTTSANNYDLQSLLPGQWVGLPNEEYYTYVYSFAGDGMVAHGFAASEADTNLDNWSVEGVWITDMYTWNTWSLEGGDLVIYDDYGDTRMTITVQDENTIVLSYAGTTDQFPMYRMGSEPQLLDYLLGTWVPDEPDENGVYAALGFYIDGYATVTVSQKLDEAATVYDWGFEDMWEIIGTNEGTWFVDGDAIAINMQGVDDYYAIEKLGPNNCIIYYGESWQTSYTRVMYAY
jgi:hypothetical protein